MRRSGADKTKQVKVRKSGKEVRRGGASTRGRRREDKKKRGVKEG